MLHAYQQNYAAANKNSTTEALLAYVFREFLKSVSEMNSTTFICWNTFYCETVARQQVSPRKNGNPVVVDPANPTNDVANRMQDWGQLAAYAQATLKHFDKQEMAGLSRMMSELRSENQCLRDEVKVLRADIARFRKEAFHRSVTTTAAFAAFQPGKDVIPFELAGLKWKIHFHNKEQLLPSLELPPESVKELGDSGWGFSVTGSFSWQYHTENDSWRNEVKGTMTFKPGSTHLMVTSSWVYLQVTSKTALKVKATISL